MSHDLTRRLLVGGAGAAGFAAGTIRAQAAGPEAAPRTAGALEEPPTLLGQVRDGQVTLPPLLAATEVEGKPANPDAPGRRLGIAVVGLGHLTLEQVLPAFGSARHVRLAALVSGERDKARTIAGRYGVPAVAVLDYAGFDRLRDMPEVDIVYVALPNAMHREWTERAAAAGKHVLCEKPMATSVADAEAMIAACRRAGRRLMIAYRCQYEPHHRALIGLARGGQHGRIRLITAVNGQNNADDGQWRHVRAMSGGGSLPDVGLYCLNAARYITGEEPVSVAATLTRPAGDRRFREVEDVCSFMLHFPSGAVAACSSGYSFHQSNRLRVQCEAAWMGLDPAFAYDGIRLHVSRKEGAGEARREVGRPPAHQFAREMDHFADAIQAGRTPHTPGEEGLADQKVIAAIYEAAAGGGTVRLPLVTGTDASRGPAPGEG